MNHKFLKKLSIGLLVAGSIGGISYAAVQAINSNNTTAVSKPTTQLANFENMANFSVSPKDPISNKYRLTINNKDESKGTVTFKDGSIASDFAVGEEIFLVVDIHNIDYTIQTIRVHSASNVNEDGNGNDNVGVYKENDASYKFTLPSETNPDGTPNPFYDESNKLSVDVAWTLKKINAWEYDWMDNTDSGVYAINLNQDFIFDDVENPELQMKTLTDSVTGEAQPNVIFRIYMNGHNMAIRNMTIPSGVQLMFINNKANTYEGQIPMVSLTKDSKFTEASVHGGVGRWGSVDFSKEVKVILNLWVSHGWWDSNANE